MLIEQRLIDGRRRWIDLKCVERHTRDRLKHDSILDCLLGRTAPREGSVSRHDDARNLQWIDPTFQESLGNYDARVVLVGLLDFLSAHATRDRYRSVEMVGVRGTEARNLPLSLRPTHRVTRVRVHDTANSWKCPIEIDMCR